MARKALGRGLSALISEPSWGERAEGTGPTPIPIDRIEPNPWQPRRDFGEEELEELKSSIRAHGLLQPILVRRVGDSYQLVAGERRLQACRGLGMAEIPALVVEADDRQMLELALVENIQRQDLSPLEVAEAIERLMADFELTQEEVANRLGWSRSAVANKVRLLRLSPQVREMLRDGSISEGHAKVLAGLEPELQLKLAERVASTGMSVRALEETLRGNRRRKPKGEGVETPQEIREAASRASKGVKLAVTRRGEVYRITLEADEEGALRLLRSIAELFPGK